MYNRKPVRDVLTNCFFFFLAFNFLSLLFFSRQVFAQSTSQLRIRLLQEKADSLLQTDRVKESIPYLKKIYEIQPFNEKAGFRLALALLNQEGEPSASYISDCREAARILSQCAALMRNVSERGPELGLRYFYLGMAHWFAGDALRAITDFQNSYRADFLRIDSVYNQYVIQEELGNESEARLLRQQYIRLAGKVQSDD